MRALVPAARSAAKKPYEWYENIGEIHYAIDRGARVAGYAQLYVCKVRPDGEPGEPVTTGLPGAIGRSLISPYGGTRELVSRFYKHMTVPGDSLMVKSMDGSDFVGYETLSPEEVRLADEDGFGAASKAMKVTGISRLTMRPGTSSDSSAFTHQIAGENILGRIWRPSSRWIDESDSPLKAIQSQCEILHLLTVNLKAKLLSRLALNGILFVPQQLNQVTYPFGKDRPGMTTIDRLMAAATASVVNHDKPESAVPVMVSGDAAVAEAVRFIEMDRAILETDMLLRAELLDRILMSLDVQPMDVKGMGDSNHWSAWAVSDDERRINIQPIVEMLCWALTKMVLWREMLANGRSAENCREYMVWYDLTDANVKTNIAEDARQLHDRIVVSSAAARRMSGVEEADAPNEEEYVRQLGVAAKDPYLATFGLEIAKKIDWSKVATQPKTGPDPNSPADAPKVGPGTGKKPGGPTPESNTPRSKRPA